MPQRRHALGILARVPASPRWLLTLLACAPGCVGASADRVAGLVRPSHVRGAGADTAAGLLQELRAQERAQGRLPDAVAGPQLEAWMEEGGGLDAAWVDALGYEHAQCVYEVEWGGRGMVGEPALLLRPRTVACLPDGRALAHAIDALNAAGVPVSPWLSQGFYLDVPARRWAAARDALQRVEERLGLDLGVYPPAP